MTREDFSTGKAATEGQGRAGLWGGLAVGTAGAVLGLRLSGAIDSTTGYLLALVPVALMFVYYRAAQRAGRGHDGAGVSSAVRRYLRGMMASALAYMLGLGVALWVWRNLEPSQAVTWLLAMLPILPIFWMIYVMGRYVAEETDEYLRHRAIMASLVGLGFVLAIGSFWGFLETFELVPHVPGWWAVPIWAVGMALGQFWQSRG